MSKYDMYTVTKTVGSKTRPTVRSLSVLFEAGDSVDSVILEAENLFSSVELPVVVHLIAEVESLSQEEFFEVLFEVLLSRGSKPENKNKKYKKAILRIVETSFGQYDNDEDDDD